MWSFQLEMMMQRFDAETELSQNVRSRFFIDGAWTEPASTRVYQLVSPLDEQPWIDVPLASASDVDAAVEAARRANDRRVWAGLPPQERGAFIAKLASELRKRLPLIERVWTAQVGAPTIFVKHPVSLAIGIYDYYADLAARFPFRSEAVSQGTRACHHREPVGVAALLIPWNAPFPLLAFKLAPALAAGCTVVIKTAIEAPFEALIVAEAAEAAGFPRGVVNVITADREESARLVASAAVDKVSFTGSTAVGKEIAKSCIDRMARFTLEMGGKSAAILLEDVALDAALPALAPFTMPFAGQVCFAQTRILAPISRMDEISSAYSGGVAHLNVGDPWLEDTHIGPLVNARQRDRTLAYIAGARSEGAALVAGGEPVKGRDKGFFVAPTVFRDVTRDMTIAREEIFGPVISILAYEDIDEAVALANDTDYGLSGSVFGPDAERAYTVASRIRTGQVGVNGIYMNPAFPFGGFKQSGFGREGGVEGLEAFLESRMIYLPAVA